MQITIIKSTLSELTRSYLFILNIEAVDAGKKVHICPVGAHARLQNEAEDLHLDRPPDAPAESCDFPTINSYREKLCYGQKII